MCTGVAMSQVKQSVSRPNKHRLGKTIYEMEPITQNNFFFLIYSSEKSGSTLRNFIRKQCNFVSAVVVDARVGVHNLVLVCYCSHAILPAGYPTFGYIRCFDVYFNV